MAFHLCSYIHCHPVAPSPFPPLRCHGGTTIYQCSNSSPSIVWHNRSTNIHRQCAGKFWPPNKIPMKDIGVRLYYMLRGSKQLVSEMLSCFFVVSPHSMAVEKCISTYNMLFTDLRMATSSETLVNRLFIYWNGVPTAKFDPRPAVDEFLARKDRRMNLPKMSSFAERDFVVKFSTIRYKFKRQTS